MSAARLIDNTLREGDQAAGVWLDPADKLALFTLLDRAGVACVDAGMPAVGEGERALLRLLSARSRQARVAASTRARVEEIDAAAACGVDEVFIIYPVSLPHRTLRLGLDANRWRELGLSTLERARRHGLRSSLVLEDASRASPEERREALTIAREGGADCAMLCDTVGVLTPGSAAAMVREGLEVLGGALPVGVHFHNDFGMATANTVAALEVGALFPSATVAGVGERAGNAVMAEVVAASHALLGIDLGVDRAHLAPLTREVERRTGVLQGMAAPVTGPLAFDHESGIHVHGVLIDPTLYEGLDPTPLGRRRRLVFGKHSGRAGLAHWAQARGLPTDDHTLEQVLRRVKATRPVRYPAEIDRVIASRNTWLYQRGLSDTELTAHFDAVRREAPLGGGGDG